MARTSTKTYDPKTGTWTSSSTDTSSSSSSTGTTTSTSSGTSGVDNLTSSSSNVEDSVGSTEQQYNYIEINTLEGELYFIANNATIKLRAGDTITLKGIGKYLSGKYYIKTLERTLSSSSGYSHKATVIRTDFGNSLKVSTDVQTKVTAVPVSSTQQGQLYTVKAGDCLWKIAKEMYGSGADYTKIYDANTGQIANPNLIYPGQVFTIP